MKKYQLFSLIAGMLLFVMPAKAGYGDDAFTAKTDEGWTMVFQIISEEEKTCMVGAQFLNLNDYLLQNVSGVLQFNPESWDEATQKYTEQYTINKVTVPAEVNGYKVKKIREMAFRYFLDLEEVILPEGLEVIDAMTFSHCENLKSINFPTTLQTIGGMAFEECDALDVVILPEGLTAIYGGAFKAAGVKMLALPSTLTTLGSEAFSYNPLQQVYARMQTPIEIPMTVFTQLSPVTHQPAQKSGALFVTPGLADTYKAMSCWNDVFLYIWDHMTFEEWNPTGIESIEAGKSSGNASYYDVNGRQLPTPRRGLNIVIDNDGKASKVIRGK